MYPCSSSSTVPLSHSVLGIWPMYTNTPLTGSVRGAPVLTFSTSRASTISVPSIRLGMESHTSSTFWLANTRSWAMGAARNWSRRCTR